MKSVEYVTVMTIWTNEPAGLACEHWYHYQCVGLDKFPEGFWSCHFCLSHVVLNNPFFLLYKRLHTDLCVRSTFVGYF